jgi:copper chaperone CopZ
MNVVQEALSGLPGIEKVTVDPTKDLLHVRYDPAKVTREQMLQAVDKVGYEGKVIPDDAASKT